MQISQRLYDKNERKLQSSDTGIKDPAERHLRRKWKIICLNSLLAFMLLKLAVSNICTSNAEAVSCICTSKPVCQS